MPTALARFEPINGEASDRDCSRFLEHYWDRDLIRRVRSEPTPRQCEDASGSNRIIPRFSGILDFVVSQEGRWCDHLNLDHLTRSRVLPRKPSITRPKRPWPWGACGSRLGAAGEAYEQAE